MITDFSEEDYDIAKSNDKLPLRCEYCGNIFYIEKRQIKFELLHKRGRLKFCCTECSDNSHNKKHSLKCTECGKDIIVANHEYCNSENKHFFCSHSCSAKYNNRRRGWHKEETKLKIKKGVEKYNATRPKKEYICKICGKKYNFKQGINTKKFCSLRCQEEFKKNRKKYLSKETINKLRKAGLHSADVQKENRRSKNEIYFYEICTKHFNDVKHNEQIFNGWDADIIVDDIKVAILWNGKWHYEQIKKQQSLKQIQNRDNLKIKAIKEYGYIPYIIKDMGKHNKEFVENEFKKFLNIYPATKY